VLIAGLFISNFLYSVGAIFYECFCKTATVKYSTDYVEADEKAPQKSTYGASLSFCFA